MENSADALKIAFAVLVFVIAITVFFSLISQVKSTSEDLVKYADKTTYQSYTDSYDVDGNVKNDKTANVEEVISKMYAYYTESCCITINFNDSRPDIVLDSDKSIYGSVDALEKELDETAKVLSDNYGDDSFSEKFDEVVYSGSYILGEDGTQVTTAAGGKKIYITYTQK